MLPPKEVGCRNPAWIRREVVAGRRQVLPVAGRWPILSCAGRRQVLPVAGRWPILSCAGRRQVLPVAGRWADTVRGWARAGYYPWLDAGRYCPVLGEGRYYPGLDGGMNVRLLGESRYCQRVV